MESKMLSIRSFEKNQKLLSVINKIIIHERLKSFGEDDRITQEEINQAKEELISFFDGINKIIGDNYKGTRAITGADFRERAFIRNFIDAKNKSQKFKSILFKESPSSVIELLKSPNQENSKKLIDALTDLRTLIDEHLVIDIKDLVGDI